jgi:Family of unknown function (DUF6263)
MSRNARTFNRLAIGVVAATTAATAGVPVVASAGSDGEGPDIVVENAGDQTNAISVPAPAQVGQTAQTTIAVDMDLAVDDGGVSTDVAVGLAMDFTMEVTDVSADGGYVTLLTLDAVEVTDMPEGADSSGVPCFGIEGLQLEQTLDAAGNTLSIEPVGTGLGGGEMACVQQFSSTQSQSAVIFPAEPIGPGASWTAELVVENQGIELPVSYHYVLTDVSNGRYSIETTLESEFDVTQSGVNVTGTMSGSGTTSGDPSNPLDISSTFKATTDLLSSLGGTDMVMTVDMTIDMATAPPAS